LTLQSQC